MRGVVAAERVVVRELPITLGQLLKLMGEVRTGGAAKQLLAQQQVRVNGQVETRRGRKLYAGDVVELPDGRRWLIQSAGEAERPAPNEARHGA